MATLRIEAGPLSYEKTATNAKADRIVTACSLAWGYAGDTEDKASVLAYFGAGLVRRLEEIASAEEDRRATSSALATTSSDRPMWSG